MNRMLRGLEFHTQTARAPLAAPSLPLAAAASAASPATSIAAAPAFGRSWGDVLGV